MKVKRVIMGIILSLALVVPVVQPGIVEQTEVSQAKAYNAKSVKSVRKMFNKIKYGMKYKKVKSILGGKPTKIENLMPTIDGSTMGIYIWYYMVSSKTNSIAVEISISIVSGKASTRMITEIYT